MDFEVVNHFVPVFPRPRSSAGWHRAFVAGKYPDEKSYREFIGSCGGGHNAYTACEVKYVFRMPQNPEDPVENQIW